MSQGRVQQIIQELREEHALISRAIAILEAIKSGKPRRGRPPKYLA